MRPHNTATTRFLAALFLAMALAIYPVLSIGVTAKTVAFVFNDIDNRPVRLADFRGQWVLVAFWAPWCPLCKVELPALKELDRRPDLAVISIGLDYDSPAALRDMADDHGFRVVAGGRRRDANSPHRQVGPVDFFPTSYLYDPAGEIAMYIPGQVRAAKVLAFMNNWPGTQVASAPAPAGRTDLLASVLSRTYGKTGGRAYADWRAMVDGVASAGTAEKLARVNAFFNQRIKQSSDRNVWGRQDYWATLGEVLGKGAGDGEDFAIAKYFTLRALQVPPERLRLVYVKTLGAARDSNDPVHMVLAYFDTPSQEPALLDSRTAEILPASRRPELRPIFSFNSEGSWGDDHDPLRTSSDAGSLPIWEDTLRRARNEGFD